jgi:hypothetical protein
MKTIYKYPIKQYDVTSVSMPENAYIIKGGIQEGNFFIWAVVDTENTQEERHNFAVIGTGHEVPYKNISHIDSIQHGIYVWHIFEIFKF